MKHKNNKLKLSAMLLLIASFSSANAFNLNDYFDDDKPSDDLAQEAPQEAPQKTAQAAPAETYKAGRSEQFDQWRLQCIEAQSSGKEQCNLLHQINNKKKQQIIKIEVLKSANNNSLLFHLPLGTYLPAGAVLVVGTSKHKMPITSCMPAGCRAQLSLDWNIDQQLKREEKATVQLLHINQRQKINIEFSLMGFSKGSKEVL